MSIKSQIQELTDKPINALLDHKLDENAPFSAHVAEIISLNEDAASGFRRAAVMMEDDQDELLFTTYANQRDRFASTLRSMAEADSGNEKDERSAFTAFAEQFVAQAHRAWMTLRASMSDSKLRTMLKECLRGDERMIKHYDAAIKAAPRRSKIHDRLTDQRADIKAVTETLRRLIDETANMS